MSHSCVLSFVFDYPFNSWKEIVFFSNTTIVITHWLPAGLPRTFPSWWLKNSTVSWPWLFLVWIVSIRRVVAKSLSSLYALLLYPCEQVIGHRVNYNLSSPLDQGLYFSFHKFYIGYLLPKFSSHVVCLWFMVFCIYLWWHKVGA